MKNKEVIIIGYSNVTPEGVALHTNIPDDEPYENGVVEEALFEEGVAALSGHKCERCGHIQNINI